MIYSDDPIRDAEREADRLYGSRPIGPELPPITPEQWRWRLGDGGAIKAVTEGRLPQFTVDESDALWEGYST